MSLHHASYMFWLLICTVSLAVVRRRTSFAFDSQFDYTSPSDCLTNKKTYLNYFHWGIPFNH